MSDKTRNIVGAAMLLAAALLAVAGVVWAVTSPDTGKIPMMPLTMMMISMGLIMGAPLKIGTTRDRKVKKRYLSE
jgi:hypothetical protein